VTLSGRAKLWPRAFVVNTAPSDRAFAVGTVLLDRDRVRSTGLRYI